MIHTDSITRTPLEYAYFLLIGREWKLNAHILSLAVFDSALFPCILRIVLVRRARLLRRIDASNTYL